MYNCTYSIPFQHVNQKADFEIKNLNLDQLNPLLIGLNVKKFDILKLILYIKANMKWKGQLAGVRDLVAERGNTKRQFSS